MATRSKQSKRRRRRRRVLTAAAGVLIAALVAGYFVYPAGSNLTAEDYFDRALTLSEQGEHRAALIEVKNALQSNPGHAAARALAGRLYLRAGDGPSAEKELGEAVKLGLDTPEVTRDLLRALLQQGRYREVAGRLLQLTPEHSHPALYLIRGEAWLGAGEMDNARADFTQVLSLDPDNVEARQGLAKVALATKDIVEAGQQIERTLSDSVADLESWVLKGEVLLQQRDFTGAETAFEAALDRNEDHLLARVGLVRALLAGGKSDEALENIEILRQANPHSAVNSYLAALAARQKGDLSAMKAALREVLKVSPNHPPSLLLLGAVHYREQEFELARELLSRFVTLSPDNLHGKKLLAAVMIKQQSYQESISLLEEAVAGSPDDPHLLALLGSAYMAIKDFDKANGYMERAAKLQPDISAVRAQLALTHFATGDAEKGINELEAISAADPEFKRAEYLLLLFHLRNKQYEEALAIGRKLADEQPENPIPLNLIAAAQEGLGDFDAARAVYGQALSIKPDYLTAALNLARMDYQAGDLERAGKRYQEVLEIDPRNVFSLEALARLSLREGRTGRATQLLERARAASDAAVSPRILLAGLYLPSDPALALTVAQEAYSLAPNHPTARQVVARSYLANRKFPEAREVFEGLVLDNPEVADLHYRLGLAQAGEGDQVSARASWQRTLELNPEHLESRVALARTALVEGDPETALQTAKTIQVRHPTAPDGWTLEGDVLYRQGSYREAITAFQEAQGILPQSLVVGKIAAIYSRLGETESAFETMSTWLDRYPRDQKVRVALAAAYQSAGNVDAALEHYNLSIELGHESALVLNNMAWIYHEKRDPRALEAAKRAYELVPDQPEIADTYGWLLVQDGRVERGLSLLSRAADGAPDNHDIRYHWAAGLALAGDESAARVELERLLASDTSFTERASAEKLMKDLGKSGQ